MDFTLRLLIGISSFVSIFIFIPISGLASICNLLGVIFRTNQNTADREGR